jgi:hypothetical protein
MENQAQVTWTLTDGRKISVDAVKYGTGYTARARVEGKELGRGWTTRVKAPAHFQTLPENTLAIIGNKIAVKDAEIVARIEILIEDAELADKDLQTRHAATDAAIEREVNAKIAYDERKDDHNRKCCTR